jgi:hypothetical protein
MTTIPRFFLYCNAEMLELFASMPEEWKDFPRNEGLHLNYKEWPLPYP